MGNRKVIYIAGPITGVKRYWEAFEKAEDELLALGFIPLSPSRLPGGLTNAQYARLNFPGWDDSKGAKLEMSYCIYIDKPIITNLEFLSEVLG